jgi:Tol biopolymer transport system component
MGVPFLVVLAALGGHPLAPPAVGSGGNLVMVSVDSDGRQCNSDSRTTEISADGGWVVFVSAASNLVAGDHNAQADVFLHEVRTGATTRISVSSSGEEGALESVSPVVSRYGRRVAFQSDAANLVPGDTNGFADIFVRDVLAGTTTRVSLGTHDGQAELPCVEPSISDDGRFVAFLSYSENLGCGESLGIQDVFVRDLPSDTLACVSLGLHGLPADNSSWGPSLSSDGRYVVFYSQATNLVPGDLNGAHDVFVHDRQTGRTELVSVSTSGQQGQGPSQGCRISSDGRFVAFMSFASNFDPFDDNTDSDVFVHDRVTGVTELVSRNSLGEVGNEESEHIGISGNGRWVVFHSMASNLGGPPDPFHVRDVYLRDRLLGVTTCLSLGLHLAPGSDESQGPVIASDIPVVSFESRAENLIGEDTNGLNDVFIGVRF